MEKLCNDAFKKTFQGRIRNAKKTNELSNTGIFCEFATLCNTSNILFIYESVNLRELP